MNHRNQPKFFLDINIGDKAQFDVEVDGKMHDSFTGLFRDFSPIHCDDKFCSDTKFEKKIGYAFMLTGFLSRLYGEYLPGGSSVCIKQNAKFVKPFYIGDRITVMGEVVNKIASTQFVELKTEMYRDNKECVFRGDGVVQILFKSASNQPLYEIDNRRIYYSDFINALDGVGIKRGDTIFVHSDVSMFGKLCVFDKTSLLDSLINVIKEAVGEDGTIIMPTFSYSFCDNDDFNVTETKSTVGVLTEYFRKTSGVARTVHPNLSVAIWGRHKKKLLDISKDSFDGNSIFGKLHRGNGKLVFLGAPFQSCTFLHYIEQAHGVPYRFMKSFRGVIKDSVEEHKDEYTYFVRDLDKDVILDTARLERHLLDKGLLREARVGNGRLLTIEADILFKEGLKLLDKDPFFFLKGEPK